MPDFNISVYKSRAGELSGWGAEFKMSIPLYFWMEQTGKIKEASANLDSNQIKLEAVRKNIISAIKNTYESVQANEEQVKNFEQNLLPEVEDGLKTGINNYQTGQIDVLNLIDIYRTYKFARIERKKLYITI